MKKSAKFYAAIAAAVLLAGLLAVPSGATSQTGAKELFLVRAVAISNTEIILEFSMPIVMNYNGAERGPWLSIRVCDKDTYTLSYENEKALQIGGEWEIIGEGDRIKFTMRTENNIGARTIPRLLDLEGSLSRFADKDIYFSIEEIPREGTTNRKNYYVDNVSTDDGEYLLRANTDYESETRYEGIYVPIEVDFDHDYKSPVVLPETSVPESTSESSSVPASQSESASVSGTEKKNGDIYTYLIIGGAVVVAAAVVVTIVVSVRKKK